MDERLAQAVRIRARHCCEYCRMPARFYPTVPFPIDHIIARQHEGPTALSNLALSCLHCNSHKGTNIAGIDPMTRRLTRLFNPRRHKWSRHFRWRGALLASRTAIGRTTVAVLALNHPDLMNARQALVTEGVFPPEG